MSKKPTSIRDAKKEAKKLEKQLNPTTATKKKSSSRPKQKELTLHQAYEIVGGYTNTISPNVMRRAFELVMQDDPEFAKKLQSLYNLGTSLKKANDDQLASAQQVELNAQTLNTEYSNEAQLKEDVFDEETQEALDNTPVEDGLSREEQQQVVFATAQNEVIPELTENQDFSNATPQEKHSMLVTHLRNSVKRILFKARLESLGRGIKNIKDALNFKHKVSISSKSITSFFEKAYTKTSSYIKNISRKGHTKAAALLNKVKTRASSVAIKGLTFLTLSTSLLGCDDGRTAQPYENAHQTTVQTVDTTKIATVQPVDTAKVATDSIPTIALQDIQTTQNADSISVPTEFSSSFGISNVAYASTRTFLGDRYETDYKKITDGMLEKSGFETREQFLNAYRVMRSFYPNVVENQGDVLLQRSETSETFSKFFNNDDCVKEADLTDEDYQILRQAPTLEGNLNRRATSEEKGSDPCDAGKVHYVDGVSRSVQPKETKTPVSEIVSFEETGQSSVIEEDSVIVQNTIEETGRSRVQVVEVADTTTMSIDILKGNNLQDGQLIGSENAGVVSHKSPQDVNHILIEDNGFVETGSSRVVSDASTLASVDSVSTLGTGFIESGSSRIVTSEVTDSTLVSSGGFEESGRSTTVTLTDNVVETDSVQIVEDSTDLPRGTPAAGYVAERGGVNNCGLTAKQLQYSKSKIMDSFGESAYEDLMDGISDEMLSKGNIFEGLTREEAIYNLSVWSVNFPHSPETTLIFDYVLNCHQGETMSAEDEASAKAAMDRIRVNKTIDGVVYSKPIYVQSVKNMGCDESVQINSVPISRTVSPTSPSGPKFPRYFMLRPTRSEPMIPTFDEELGASRTEIEYVYQETQAPIVQKYKANEDFSDSQYIGDIEAQDIANKEVSGRNNILVEETDQSGQTSIASERASSPKKDKKTKKKVSKGQQDQSYYDSLTPEEREARLEAARRMVEHRRY